MAVEVGEWLAVLWMVMNDGRNRLAPRRCRDPDGMSRILILASFAKRVMLLGKSGRESVLKL